MTNKIYILVNGTLYHHGIKGQKWGTRRFQNEDGSYTAKGQAENNGHGRYADMDALRPIRGNIKTNTRNKSLNGFRKSRCEKYVNTNKPLSILFENGTCQFYKKG